MRWILAALLLTAGAGSAYAQALPQPKPQMAATAHGAEPQAKLPAGQAAAQYSADDDAVSALIQRNGSSFAAADDTLTKSRRHLGDINEDSPLIAPRSRQLFGEPISPLGKEITPLGKANRHEPAAGGLQPAPMPLAAINIDNYPLTETILARLEKIHKEIIQLPDPGSGDDDTDSNDIDTLAKALEKRPDIMEVLGRNLMNARDYIMAMQAVFNALAATTGAGDEQTSAANIAFGKQYANRIRNLLEE